MIPPYSPEVIAELARQQHLPLAEDRLELVAATLTHIRNFIQKLEDPASKTSSHTESSSDENL
ncbi:hypothetical protein [Nitratireductor basaltis]|uniref:Uncharacterized protein n=1 Tax=Nitratireductor basaltis TaxID=472175 RepID=A0A084U8M6_9HYPH|nr:hypothetical protein [Nitratireductor basaltis]KFB09312.1 hypothetical protein EL18_00327 [Nitratireductor basaltis]